MRTFLVSLCATLLTSCAMAIDGVAPMPPDVHAIDDEVRRQMAREDVKGLALAIIQDGAVVHLATFGHRNVEKSLPLEPDTVMYGASFTKTAFAYMTLQLVDEGKIDLDRPIADYLAKPIPSYENYEDLEGDERWRRLTPRHVLTHSTGFHNFRWLEDDRVLRFHFEPGERYAYSGEGFYLLQFLMEEALGLDVKAEMQRRIFDRFGMPNTSMQWREDFAENLADGYRIDGSFEPHDERSNVSAAGSMDTTIRDQAALWAGMAKGEGISRKARNEFIRPQRTISTKGQFPPLWETYDPRGPASDLSAGLGLVTYQGAEGLAWFKGGHNEWTGNFVVCREEARDCIVLMSNSVRAELIYPDLVQFIWPDSQIPFWWEYGHVE